MDHDEIIKKQIQNLNRHLPKGRISLEKLLEQDKPRVENRDGDTHRFKRRELEYLADLLPPEKHSKLRLPIIVRISPELGRGASKISGKIEREVIEKILEKEGDEDELVIYRPEIRKIRRKLPTTTQYAFMISSTKGKPYGRTR
ncbi:hypothetical protein AKJ39_02100 [candidate division MSBL1 archaeon SCGC-AAA259J03]|uniref:UPF0216 protein AKJ39_02100 n=3 Tax=candidate division MSBL1 TaxID=215777 RepID=A0A656YWR5_9EURY|nr:hypothetical protein AKJ61_00155 [candidate division MSBL1 archaeon SCGC-AAA259B11]KXA95533.1 hypothetical protein AKJ36_00370 [candidate division MSBL1 archaeon SCGC-AAA259I07]KXA98435.1 hypothetical protein AKJ39_02100 [candidate division MSBL1 archaeon SCGC-AAA259J03]